MKARTPDQIRRQTVPVKHTGLLAAFLASILGLPIWFGGWWLFHQEQVRRYPDYCSYAAQSTFGNIHLYGPPPKTHVGITASELRYRLLRYGNETHRYDQDILDRGWYPNDEPHPRAWVFAHGAVTPIYADAAPMVFKWPITLWLFTILAASIWGLIHDYRYRTSIIAGVPFDGSILATVHEYNHEVKGDGMRYAVKAWKDR